MADATYHLNGGFKPTMNRFADLSGPDFSPTSPWRGNIQLTPRLPSPRDLIRGVFTGEGRIRPYYKGTGATSGYHVLTVGKNERWILEPRVYWAYPASGAAAGRRQSPMPS